MARNEQKAAKGQWDNTFYLFWPPHPPTPLAVFISQFKLGQQLHMNTSHINKRTLFFTYRPCESDGEKCSLQIKSNGACLRRAKHIQAVLNHGSWFYFLIYWRSQTQGYQYKKLKGGWGVRVQHNKGFLWRTWPQLYQHIWLLRKVASIVPSCPPQLLGNSLI